MTQALLCFGAYKAHARPDFERCLSQCCVELTDQDPEFMFDGYATEFELAPSFFDAVLHILQMSRSGQFYSPDSGTHPRATDALLPFSFRQDLRQELPNGNIVHLKYDVTRLNSTRVCLC